MLTNGFGIIAFISVTPLITVQALGILYTRQIRVAKRRQDALDALEYDELASLAASIADDEGEDLIEPEEIVTDEMDAAMQAQTPQPEEPDQQPDGTARETSASPTGGIAP